MNKYNKYVNSFIKNLYFNDGITHGELAKQLGTTPSSLSNRVAKYLSIEPPIFSREKIGKNQFYHLTEYGKNYYEQIFEKEEVINYEQKELLISYILKNNDSADDFCAKLLKRIDVTTIATTFTFNEFMFLALTLGMIESDKSMENAFKITIPNQHISKQLKWGNNVYEKYRNMILTNLDTDTIEQHIPSHNIQKSFFFRNYGK